MSLSHPRLCQDTARAGVVCVGDKAMLQVEEPISYPLNEVGEVLMPEEEMYITEREPFE